MELKKGKIKEFMSISLFCLTLVPVLCSCNENNTDSFKADFSYEYADDNHLIFSNLSDGEYYSLTWDFGNGTTETTTDKNETYKIYYPQAGDYDVSLTALNYSGDKKSAVKTVTIANSDLVISFTAEVDPVEPNFVNLKNTSTGSYDSFQWIFRDKNIENEAETRAYFPYAGQYTIVLEITKGSDTYTSDKNVTIAQDDPDYVGNLTLMWSDEFDGSTVNTDNWKFETGAGGWGNNELQYYTNGDNAEVKDGILTITAKKVDDLKQAGSYTSTRIITSGKKEFQYGRMEIRAKLPSGTGIWPAIWMLGSNIGTVGWPKCGETDIMEYVGYTPNTVFSTIHTQAGYGESGSGISIPLATCEEEFHNYGIIWTEDYIKFYIDEPNNITFTYAPETKTADNWPFDQPQFFILNVAVGGNWGGAQGIDNSIFPQTMEIDYVRVYQEN